MSPTLTRTTALITGATEGIGYETARLLATDGFSVVLHARTSAEGELALERLVKADVDPLRLSLVVADFTRLSEVKAMAEDVAEAHPGLDVLVNNAATAAPEGRTVTEDGNEVTFQVNYLAPYLLTRLLASTMPAGSRVVNLSSALHRGAALTWSDLNHSRRYRPGAAYGQSKLALTVFTTDLARFGPETCAAVSVDPGVTNTRLLALYGHSGQPAESAAASVARLCSPRTEIVNGAYYNGPDLGTPTACATDPRTIVRLMKASGHMTNDAGATHLQSALQSAHQSAQHGVDV